MWVTHCIPIIVKGRAWESLQKLELMGEKYILLAVWNELTENMLSQECVTHNRVGGTMYVHMVYKYTVGQVPMARI